MTPCVPIGARPDQPFAAPALPACARTRQIWEVLVLPFTPVSLVEPATMSSAVTPIFGVAYVAIPMALAVPEAVEGEGLLLITTALYSKVQAAITSARDTDRDATSTPSESAECIQQRFVLDIST